jgi:2-methylisocitrate lyase-like PEP mutase family enzyme
MPTQQEKAAAFQALHRQSDAFIIANAWDAGSTRILAAAGFSAIATTSAGFAFSLGRQDNTVGREGILRNAADIVAATDLPVSADLENGFGDTAESAAETIRQAATIGLVGGSIEDSTYDKANPLYDIRHAADRIRAAVEAARAQPFPFVLTARAENFLVGRPDLTDAIKRLQAYQDAGADVLYAPGLTREDDIRSVVQSVDRPVNVVMGLMDSSLDLTTLSQLGVKRISVGSALARLAFGALQDAAREMKNRGTFGYANRAAPYGVLSALFAHGLDRPSNPG